MKKVKYKGIYKKVSNKYGDFEKGVPKNVADVVCKILVEKNKSEFEEVVEIKEVKQTDVKK